MKQESGEIFGSQRHQVSDKQYSTTHVIRMALKIMRHLQQRLIDFSQVGVNRFGVWLERISVFPKFQRFPVRRRNQASTSRTKHMNQTPTRIFVES